MLHLLLFYTCLFITYSYLLAVMQYKLEECAATMCPAQSDAEQKFASSCLLLEPFEELSGSYASKLQGTDISRLGAAFLLHLHTVRDM